MTAISGTKMTAKNAGCLTVLLKLIGIDLERFSTADSREQLPYRLRDHFLSAAELSFFHVLRSVVKTKYRITTKVRVSDLLFVVQRHKNMGHANRIDRKHVDFVLCDPETMQPKLVIELDDSSHSRKDRADRDKLIDAAFTAAGLPILHVIARNKYSLRELAEQIAASVADKVIVTNLANSTQSTGEIPSCPKCRIPMVQRKATKGSQKGKQFWGCSSFPNCREVIPIN